MSDITVNKAGASHFKDIQKEGSTDIKIPRHNKNIITLAIVIFIGCILVGFILSAFSGKTSRTKAPEKQTNVTVPEFDRQITMQKTEVKQVEPVIPAEEQNPYNPYKAQKRTALDSSYLRNADYTVKENTNKPANPERNSSRDARDDSGIQRMKAEEEAARRAGITVALGYSGSRGNPDSDKTQAQNVSYTDNFQKYGNDSGAGQDDGNDSPYAGYKEANMQEEKHSFFAADKASGRVIYAEAPAVSLSNLVAAGTVIPAVLLTAINSDLPGEVLALVTSNIYSFDGENILIPQGTKLIANYNSSVSWNQQRIQVAWNRLIRPDGVSIYLGNMPGIDSKGASGTPGSVDGHPWEIVKGLGLMAAVTLLSAEIQFHAAGFNAPGLMAVTENTDEEVQNIGSKYADQALDIQPTIRVRAGKTIYVFINTDLALPEYYQ